MKTLLILFLSIILCNCTTTKKGCGTENYRRPFTAAAPKGRYLILSIDTIQNGFVVTMQHNKQYYQTTCCCTSLPDSVVVGKTVLL